MTLFRRSSAVSCYYCLSLVDPYSASSSRASPFNPRSFRCPYCGCQNRYDSRGQIIGDEPAMRDERLNVNNFSKRGLPDHNHLPSLTGQHTPTVFCRACQTNQTLLINLRAAYLPEPEDPSYASRLAQLPAYIASLQSRYPPVCPSCQPAVEDEIARKDEFARTRALANALKATSRPPSRAGSAANTVKNNHSRMKAWRIRGVLWTTSYVIAVFANAAGIIDLSLLYPLRRLIPLLPLVVLISVAWTFWDPTYSLQQKSHLHGGRVRIGGRQRYIFLQSLAWLSRLTSSILLLCSWISQDWDFLQLSSPEIQVGISRKQTYFGSALVLEISALILSYLAITIHRPVPIRLIDTSAHRALSKPNPQPNSSQANGSHSHVQPEPDFFSTLSLSGNPVITPATNVNPMFGQPSLTPGKSLGNGIVEDSMNVTFEDDDHDEDEPDLIRRTRRRDPDAMDWEPSTPAKQALLRQRRTQNRSSSSTATGKFKDDGVWLRQQRFFPPEEPTGLEGLLMRTRLMDEDESRVRGSSSEVTGMKNQQKRIKWIWVYSASVLPVAVILGALWLRSRS